MMRRRVVISGIGTLTACGTGYDPLWEAALAGRSAVRELSDFSSNGSPIRIGGEIRNFEPGDFIPSKKSLKVMSRNIQLAVAASLLAVQDAGIQTGHFDPKRAGVLLGAGLINNELDELGESIQQSFNAEGRFDLRLFGRDGIRTLYPLWLLKYLPNMSACHLSIIHSFKGPNNTLMTSSTGALQAVGEAFRIIERDDADLMLAGAGDSKINAVGLSRFRLLGILSQKNYFPQEAYCPFDRRRDGVVIGEGAGIFVLEERQHALKRGARIYGEILGYGATLFSQEWPIRRVLEESGRDSKDFGFIHAHGSGIPKEDIEEAKVLGKFFRNGTKEIPVTASKSLTGHLVDASGTSELSLSLLALQRKLIPPVANLKEPDPACDLHFVMKKPELLKRRTVLIQSLGFGGQSAALGIGQDET